MPFILWGRGAVNCTAGFVMWIWIRLKCKPMFATQVFAENCGSSTVNNFSMSEKDDCNVALGSQIADLSKWTSNFFHWCFWTKASILPLSVYISQFRFDCYHFWGLIFHLFRGQTEYVKNWYNNANTLWKQLIYCHADVPVLIAAAVSCVNTNYIQFQLLFVSLKYGNVLFLLTKST